MQGVYKIAVLPSRERPMHVHVDWHQRVHAVGAGRVWRTVGGTDRHRQNHAAGPRYPALKTGQGHCEEDPR